MEEWKPGGSKHTSDVSTIHSIDTSFAIVIALEELNGAGITELAASTGLSKSSVSNVP
jgi:hypothetical protein